MQLLSPQDRLRRYSPAQGRLPSRQMFLITTCAVLCFAVLLSGIVSIIDAMAQNTRLPAEKVPGAMTLISNAHRTTTARFDFSLATTDLQAVDPLFSAYYSQHAGVESLGVPLTPGYRLVQGVVQFFMSGALFLPSGGVSSSSIPMQWESSHFGDLSRATFEDGERVTATGIIQLPLLYSLLLDGSTLPIDGVTSTLTYARLRSAVNIKTLVPSPSSRQQRKTSSAANQASGSGHAVFILEGSIGRTPVGHTIPQPIWSYITRPDISPDGWTTDIGIPLSEVQAFTTVQGDIPHHMEVQVFEHTALVVDLDAQDSRGEPIIERLDTGLAYLETLGAPAPKMNADTTIWGTSSWANSPVLTAPATGDQLAQIGLNFPLTLDGSYQWIKGILWYEVQWHDQRSSRTGWISADKTTISAPAAGSPIWSSFVPLSSTLASYLASQGSHVSAVIFDITRNQYYLYDVPKQFYMASSVKVPIMLTLLTQLERQGREPNGEEMSLLTTMIENSNNNSAQALFDEVGGAPALDNYMHSVGISNFSAFPDAWGYSTISPLSMVRLLTLLYAGKILTAHDRGLAVYLMENIESDEQIGVGSTAPSGATVAMKDGWVPAPDDLWVMNTSGIVTLGQETYIISVYTQDEDSLDEGWEITEQVCSMAAHILTS